MTVMLVPLGSIKTPGHQTFTIDLAGTTYELTVRWNNPSQCWYVDICDASSNPIVTGIPLVTPMDLLAQYKYLGIKGRLLVQSDGDPNAVPTWETLGKSGNLYFEALDG